ncbi:hypothetical protein ILUMI_20868 [Ignelater luminosus]|uniref:Uncharacterized protein n=1 Tax=Ignelater luminosus TaxID=2038154 RepID=A0A8K0CHF9_IGNLU|nr:hypothetical protein ILUMI_20868 [Ignelater luminosus]
MSTYVKAFLETEITVIPQIMDRYIGKYYNNALYNGITWMIFILHVIHFVFDLSVNALLKKMRFKEYVRIRLRKSLWYLGFYGCSFMYCTATLWKNNIKMPHRHKFQILDLTEPISGHLILGYVLLSSFYASSSMWEGLQCSVSSFTYLFLTGFVAFTYFLRYIELAILLASTFSAIHVITELTRCLFCIIKGELGLPKLLVKLTFCISVLIFTVTYFAIIPISFVLPIARGFLKNPNSIIMAGLNVTLWGWLICEIYSSPLYRLVQHRWHHCESEKVPECLGTRIECALFLPRDDVAYNLKIIKQEIKERQARMMALRKPKKGSSMLVQTLKCVAAINRKIKYRKLLEKSSPSTSEKLIGGRLDGKQSSEDDILQADILEYVEESPTFSEETEISSSMINRNISLNDQNEDLIQNGNGQERSSSNSWKKPCDLKGIVEEDNSQQDNGDEIKHTGSSEASNDSDDKN